MSDIPALDAEAERSRYASRRWLTPDDWDGHAELAAYVEREGRLPEEWLEVIEQERNNGNKEV